MKSKLFYNDSRLNFYHRICASLITISEILAGTDKESMFRKSFLIHKNSQGACETNENMFFVTSPGNTKRGQIHFKMDLTEMKGESVNLVLFINLQEKTIPDLKRWFCQLTFSFTICSICFKKKKKCKTCFVFCS